MEIYREIGSLVPCDRMDLARPSDDGTRFVITPVHPEGEASHRWEVTRDGSFVSRVIERGKVECLPGLGAASRYPEQKVLGQQGFRSAAFIPLEFSGGPPGALILCGRARGSVKARGTQLLEKVRGLIRVAIRAASTPRGETAPAAAEVLNAFSEISARIAREEDLKLVYRIFLDAIREHSGYRRAVLTLMDEQGKDVQWMFTGFSDAEIDDFHRNRMTPDEIRSILKEPHRIGNSYRLAPAASGSDVVGSEPLILPLQGAGGVLLGTLMVDDRASGCDLRAGVLAGLELFTCQIAHVLEKRRLDRAMKRSQTRLRATQEQLMQADKMSAIGQLISGVAHELNNPLSGIMGFAQLMQTAGNSPQLAKNLERIQNEAIRCQKIVQNLLVFSRRHEPEKSHRSLNDVIEGVLELRAYQLQVDDVRVERHYDPGLPMTMLDFHQMQQVVLNVVNNAHQAMMAVVDRERCLRITTERVGDRLRARIADSGTGIPQDRLDRVFEPFFTTKEAGKGTGLGLSLSAAIVKDHQGEMSVESAVGRGTTITLELPLIEGSDRFVAPAGKEAAVGRSRPLRLLVVDDEAILTDLLTDFLKGEGHEVDQARDGRAALKLGIANDYDVILSDLKMPGLDGQGLYEQLCHAKPDMRERFVFSTGDLANPRVQVFFQSTGCRYFTKPFRLEAVLAVLNQVARTDEAA